MTEWATMRLHDLLDKVDERCGTRDIPLVLSVTEKRGIIPQDQVFRKRVATADTSKYRVLRPLDIAYNPYLLWTQAIGQWLGTVPGITSPVYETFRAKDGHAPRFVGLLLESGILTPYFDATAIGSIRRRRRTTVAVFLDAEVSVPSLAEQRRIVDVMGAVDAQIEALNSELRALGSLLNETLRQVFGSLTGPERAIDSLCATVIGGIWGKPPGEGEVDVLALGPRIYTPGTSGFVTDESPLRSLSKSQVEKRIVQVDDIILERSGGSPEQPVGRVVIAGPGLNPCVPTDFQRLLRPDPCLVSARFLYWRLRHDWTQGITRQYSRRTTGITNLSVKEYLARRVIVPDPESQRAVAALADALDAGLGSATAELAALRRYRSALLTALVSGGFTIPESYDDMLEVQV